MEQLGSYPTGEHLKSFQDQFRNGDNVFKVLSSRVMKQMVTGALMMVIFCLSPSTAACERGLSTMKRIKNYRESFFEATSTSFPDEDKH